MTTESDNRPSLEEQTENVYDIPNRDLGYPVIPLKATLVAYNLRKAGYKVRQELTGIPGVTRVISSRDKVSE